MGEQHPSPRISETARVIEALIPELPEETRTHLGRLIQAKLTVTDRHVRRYARLGLLAQMTSTGTGEVPTLRDYEAERERRAAAGEAWPSSDTLIQGHGSWVAAVKVAMRLAVLGPHQGSKEPNTDAIHHGVRYSNLD
jgi:hypothetical protein